MIIIRHKVNTVHELKETPPALGIETDIRPFGKRLVLHHEPFVEGEGLEEFLKHYRHAFAIFNIKSEGIEKEVMRLAAKFGIKDYFLLDVSFPFMIKYINEGVSKLAVRYSEYESAETCLNLKGKVEWVFVDNLTHLPLACPEFKELKKHFKICIVSPELLKRDEIPQARELVRRFPVDAVLTDDPKAWGERFK